MRQGEASAMLVKMAVKLHTLCVRNAIEISFWHFVSVILTFEDQLGLAYLGNVYYYALHLWHTVEIALATVWNEIKGMQQETCCKFDGVRLVCLTFVTHLQYCAYKIVIQPGAGRCQSHTHVPAYTSLSWHPLHLVAVPGWASTPIHRTPYPWFPNWSQYHHHRSGATKQVGCWSSLRLDTRWVSHKPFSGSTTWKASSTFMQRAMSAIRPRSHAQFFIMQAKNFGNSGKTVWEIGKLGIKKQIFCVWPRP